MIAVAQLLEVDEKKFLWALTNYCTVQKGTAVRQRQTPMEAEEARDALACCLYSRLVDWIISVINHKLFFTRAVL
jgi:myosin-3